MYINKRFLLLSKSLNLHIAAYQPHLFLIVCITIHAQECNLPSTDLPTKMQIVEHKSYLMQETLFGTERVLYEALKNTPLNKPVLYAAIPWTALSRLFRKQCRGRVTRDRLSQMFIEELRGMRITHPCSFTIYPHSDVSMIIPAIKHIGIKYVFWPHATPNQKISGVTFFPILHLSSNFSPPAQKKDILYSFIGYGDKKAYGAGNVRRKIFALPKHNDAVIKERKKFHSPTFQSDEQLRSAENEYKVIMARSRFGLCPRGAGPATYRLWECLGSGAVPVILCDGLPLPPGINWDECLVHIREGDVFKLDSIIRSISIEQEERMRQAVLRVHAFLKDDPAYFIRYCFEHMQLK